MPGGGRTRGEVQAYCEKQENRVECDVFFEQAGVKKSNAESEGQGPKNGLEEEEKESVPSIFQDEAGGPGGCKTKSECEAYCDAYPGECDTSVQGAGGEIKEVTATCSTKEECEAFCGDSANKELPACASGTIIIEKDETPAVTEGPGEDPLEKFRSDIQALYPESQECVRQIIGEEVYDDFMAGGMPEKALKREELQLCFDLDKQIQEEQDKLKMQKKPDDSDMGAPPSEGSLLDIISRWFKIKT